MIAFMNTALQVVEDWDVGMYHRLLPAVEGALQAACTDAITETRNAGRVALAAYTAVLPERGVALVKRFDGPVQVRQGARRRVQHAGCLVQVLWDQCMCSSC
jgi:hypothetical protein